jgi:phenylalanyl-tRNA synthetase beta chain
LRLANPLSDEQPYLRTTLLPGLLAALRRNVGRGSTDVALYETGLVVRPAGELPPVPRLPVDRRPTPEEVAAVEAGLPDQPVRLAAVLAGEREPAGWWGPARPAEWADAIELARRVATTLDVELEVRADEHPPWHPGRCAALLVAGEVVGHAGELHPRVVQALGLPARTAAVELALDPMLAASQVVVVDGTLSTFPVATQDVALVVDRGVAAAEVEAALRTGAGDLLESVRLFDVYEGAQVGDGRRSLAYALRFRAPDRTLTVEEATAARDAAVAEAAERTGAVLRA